MLSTDSACFVAGPRFTPMNKIRSLQPTGMVQSSQDQQSSPPNALWILALAPHWWRSEWGLAQEPCLLWKGKPTPLKWTTEYAGDSRTAKRVAVESETDLLRNQSLA